MIASIILCASIIVGILGMTGLGAKTTGILAFSGDSLWLALALTALTRIVLGTEVPTTAAYVICVSVAGPALIDMGVAPLLVHLFIFWYASPTITIAGRGGVFIAASRRGKLASRRRQRHGALRLGLWRSAGHHPASGTDRPRRRAGRGARGAPDGRLAFWPRLPRCMARCGPCWSGPVLR